MNRTLRPGGPAALAAIAACLPALTAAQAPARPPDLPAAFSTPCELKLDGTSFAAALKALQERSPGLSLLADGVPVREAADVRVAGTLRDALDAVGEAFDYSWSLSHTGAVVLRKRFSRQEERPQFHPAEIGAACADIVTVLGRTVGEPTVRTPGSAFEDPWAAHLRALAESFSAEQTQALRRGEKLPGRALLPPQADLFQAALLDRGFGVPRRTIERLARQLNHLNEGRLVAQERPLSPVDLAGIRRFNCSLVTPDLGPPGFTFFDIAVTIADIDGAGTQPAGPPDRDLTPGEPPGPGAKLTSEDEAKALTKPITVPAGPLRMSDFARAVSDGSGLTVEAAPALREHRVTVALAGFPADKALSAVCELYGWKLLKTDTGRYQIARPAAKAASTPDEAVQGIHAALPADLRTYLLGPRSGRPEMPAEGVASERLGRASASASTRLVQAIGARLARAGELRCSRMTEQEREDLVAMLLASFLHGPDAMAILIDAGAPFGLHRLTLANAFVQVERHGDEDMLLVSGSDEQGCAFGGFGPNISRGRHGERMKWGTGGP